MLTEIYGFTVFEIIGYLTLLVIASGAVIALVRGTEFEITDEGEGQRDETDQ